MKVNVLDAGLGDKGGHHFDFDRTVMRRLAEAGHEVHLYSYGGVDDAAVEALRAFGAVTKLLRPFQNEARPSVDRYAGELDLFMRQSEMLAEDLRSADDADLWIWPTIRAFNLHGCTLRGVAAPIVGCMHFDPGVEAETMEAMTWRIAILAAARKGVRFTPGTVEPELRHRLSPLLVDGRILQLPHPYDDTPIAEPKSALKRIGFFGHQRREKGTDFLEAMLRQLVADGYEVVVQNSNPQIAGPDIPGVEVLPFVDDLAGPLAACDLVVLPYSIKPYRRKGSGILAHCMALGVPVTGPLGTIPGRIIEQHQLGPLFWAPNAQGIYAAIKAAERHYAAYAASAFNGARQFAKRNGSAAFVDALLACAGPSPG